VVFKTLKLKQENGKDGIGGVRSILVRRLGGKVFVVLMVWDIKKTWCGRIQRHGHCTIDFQSIVIHETYTYQRINAKDIRDLLNPFIIIGSRVV